MTGDPNGTPSASLLELVAEHSRFSLRKMTREILSNIFELPLRNLVKPFKKNPRRVRQELCRVLFLKGSALDS